MPDTTTHRLQERVKELTALHATARLLQDDVRAEQDVLRDIVGLLPPAWQYPEIAEARIRFADLSVATPGFRTTPWMQTAAFATRDRIQGAVDVAYTEERPVDTEGPFLREERELIDSLAEMLGSYFQRRQAERELQSANLDLERLVSERTEELRQANARLRQLAAELSLTEARERRELAVDLHDRVIQEFALIKMRILQFRGDAIFCGFQSNLEEIISLLESSIQRSRQLMFEISAPILYELGLAAALEWLVEQVSTRHRIRIDVHIPEDSPTIEEAVRVTLFKCAQELLTNVVKYARAENVIVAMRVTDSEIEISVSDDGIGFDPATLERSGAVQRGFGLFSIRERIRYFGGSVTIASTAGKGTAVTLRVPREK